MRTVVQTEEFELNVPRNIYMELTSIVESADGVWAVSGCRGLETIPPHSGTHGLRAIRSV